MAFQIKPEMVENHDPRQGSLQMAFKMGPKPRSSTGVAPNGRARSVHAASGQPRAQLHGPPVEHSVWDSFNTTTRTHIAKAIRELLEPI